jgi:hypothetical protein
MSMLAPYPACAVHHAPVGDRRRPDDGRLQLTYDGHPLYRYAGDRSQADANGEGVGGQRFVVKAGLTESGPPKRCGNLDMAFMPYSANAIIGAWPPPPSCALRADARTSLRLNSPSERA